MFTDKIRKVIKSNRGREAISGYLFILPFIIGFVLLFLIPLIQSFRFSISNIEIIAGGYKLVPVGLAHYKNALLVDINFNTALYSSIQRLLIDLPTVVIFSFFAATLLNKPFKGKTSARIIFFLPVILTSGVIIALEANDLMLSISRSSFANEVAASGSGIMRIFNLSTLLTQINLPKDFIDFITNAVNHLYDVIIASGVQILIFLAALQSIPKGLYEASTIEGATGWENFWKITFPLVGPYILVNSIYTIVDTFTNAKNVVMQTIVSTSINQFLYGYGSAMAWLYFLVIVVILGVVAGTITRFVFYYDK